MKPMFLPGVEQNPKPCGYRDFIDRMQSANSEYPQIWHLFAYLPQATGHLAKFTQEIMRGPAPLSPGMRELITTSFASTVPISWRSSDRCVEKKYQQNAMISNTPSKINIRLRAFINTFSRFDRS